MSFDFLNNLETSAPSITETANIVPNVICDLTPGAFDGLIKITTILQDYGTIIIENSRIIQALSNGTSILSCDISNIIGPNINLHILNPKKYVKGFKAIKSTSNVKIIDDVQMKRYIISDNLAKIYLSKQIDDVILDNSLPDLGSSTVIGKAVTFQKEDIKRLNAFISGSDSSQGVNILVKDDQAVAAQVDDFGITKFTEYESVGITDTNADLSLKSYTFLMFDAESCEMHLAKNTDDKYWLMSKMNIGYVNISIFENIAISSDQQLLI